MANFYLGADRNPEIKWVIQKSKEQISLPLLDIPVKIIKRYIKGRENDPGAKVFPFTTNQSINSFLKIIARMAGIETNLSFHVARHTFATTIWLENGGSIQELQTILGHKNIRETMVYAKISTRLLKGSFERINERLGK